MCCFHPFPAWRRSDDTKLDFVENSKNAKYHTGDMFMLPCGQCQGCLIDRANDWATRCYCENKTSTDSCYVTFTYNDENLPKDRSLNKKDMTDFWKRLRYYNPNAKIRYIYCGEYGDELERPHYHAIIYNYRPKDLKFYKYNYNEDKLFTSKTLKKIWGKGFVIIGDVTYQSSAYVTRYVTKKIFGKHAEEHYQGKVKEFIETSRNGGIGIQYWEENKKEIIKNRGLYIKIKNKAKLKNIPKYYMKKLKEENLEMFEEIQFERMEKANETWEKILSNTNLSKNDYLDMMERNFKERTKILKRNNLI